jgi:hypothetical protein
MDQEILKVFFYDVRCAVVIHFTFYKINLLQQQTKQFSLAKVIYEIKAFKLQRKLFRLI